MTHHQLTSNVALARIFHFIGDVRAAEEQAENVRRTASASDTGAILGHTMLHFIGDRLQSEEYGICTIRRLMELKERLAAKRQEWADEAEDFRHLGTLKLRPRLLIHELTVRLLAGVFCPP